MTYKRIAALRTADDFRAHLAAPGVTLPCDETLVQPLPLAHGTIFPSGIPNVGASQAVDLRLSRPCRARKKEQCNASVLDFV